MSKNIDQSLSVPNIITDILSFFVNLSRKPYVNDFILLINTVTYQV